MKNKAHLIQEFANLLVVARLSILHKALFLEISRNKEASLLTKILVLRALYHISFATLQKNFLQMERVIRYFMKNPEKNGRSLDNCLRVIATTKFTDLWVSFEHLEREVARSQWKKIQRRKVESFIKKFGLPADFTFIGNEPYADAVMTAKLFLAVAKFQQQNEAETKSNQVVVQ